MLDPAVEHLAEEIATHEAGHLREPFDTAVETVVRRHGVDPDGWDVEDLTAGASGGPVSPPVDWRAWAIGRVRAVPHRIWC
ncbi:hypothetical protein [Saccharothrix xinjiangensis]|uniref:Uncharacterized protein n=1 Tax=Saccharothrix xinjiangensis TaxID=204798 RepID=A0ABV9Y6F9_9PSEU